MAGAFDAKVDISTKEATDGLKGLRKEVQNTGTALTGLNQIIKDSNGDIKTIANAFTRLIAAQRTAAKAAQDVAKADIDAARAAGIRNVALATEAQKLAAAGAQEAARTRNLAQGTLATNRAAESETRRAGMLTRQAAAAQRANESQQAMNDGMSNSRYLMYDVGATYAVLAAGLMAIPAATAAVAAAYQRDFAQVIRVNDELQGSQNAGKAQALKDSLKTMATDMPIAFDELSRITQLGAQMGVANDKLAAFTETTAKFVAVTGISADTGATLFGRMESSFTPDVQQFPDYFERLGSSIARVGADTVATDPEIASMLSQIGPLGAAAGMTSANVTGLAAAMASVRIQPELARGTLTRVFGALNRDVAEGSPRMAEFGKLMGLTGDEASKLWKTDSSKFFTQMIAGLNKAQAANGELTTTFDLLGIKASRDVSALTKLAVGYDVLDLSMKSANKGFDEGTALDTMSKISFDTIIAKLTEMSNSWKNLGDTLGGGALAPLAILVDTAKNLALGIDGLVHHVPAIGVLLSLLMGFATITALFLGFKAAQAFVTAGMIGFQQASARGVGAGLSLNGTLRQLAVTMLMTRGVTQQAATGFVQASGAMAGYRAGLASLNTVQTGTVGGFARFTGGIRGAASGLMGLAGGPIGIAIAGLALLSGHLLSTAIEAEAAGQRIADAMAQGAESGMRSIATELKNKKIDFGDSIVVGNLGKSLTEIATDAGVGFDKMVASVAKGKDGVKDFNKILEDLAKSKGYSSLQDMSLKNPSALGGDGALRAKWEFLSKQVEHYAGLQVGAAKSTDVANGALTKLGVPLSAVGDETEQTASDIDKMTDALKALNDEVFGTINAEANLQDSLAKLGEGLYKASNFSPNTEGGRDNLKNIEDTMTKAREYYTQMKADGTLSAQEAAQGYADFIDGLFAELKAKGADTSYVEDLAAQTRARFAAVIGGDKPLMMTVEADPNAGIVSAQATRNVVQEYLKATPPTLSVLANMDPATAQLDSLANALMSITGYPHEVVMDALTDPASEKAKEIEALLISITTGTYVAPVDADTSAAIANVQNFVAYARTELSHLQTQMNGDVGYGDGEGSMSPAQKAQYGAINAPTRVAVAPKQVRAAAPTKQAGFLPQLGGVTDGYNKAAEAAKKSGDAGKKAGKDMADGINDAVQAAEDYGSRLKTALMSAYNQQYGLTKATDDYHSALNAINKKREDELKQIGDLRDAVKALNNERDKELISANKAKIEQNISVKYGEVDRAADYGNQAQTALDNAAAKQKEIDANAKETKTLADGIGNLNGYSDAAIANREALRGLESKMIDMIAAYAAAGHNSEEVRAYAQKLTGQYQLDVAQMGYNQTAVANLQGSLERYIGVISSVPQVKPTTVTADVGGALGGIGSVASALNGIPNYKKIQVDWQMSSTVRELPGQIYQGQQVWGVFNQDGASTGKKFFNKGGQIEGFADGGMIPGRAPSDPTVDNLMAQVDGKGMIKVRSREFIQPEPAVDYYGLDAMNAIRTMKMPKFNLGGSVGGGRGGSGSAVSSIVGLDAETLAALASFQKDVKLYVDSRELASSVNEGNKILAAEGSH